jgi:hypothetical protein
MLPTKRRSGGQPGHKGYGGRPTKRSAKLTAKIAEWLSLGLDDDEVSALAGIDPHTLREVLVQTVERLGILR